MEGNKRRLRPQSQINSPYGGSLVDLIVSPKRAAALKAAARDYPSIDLTPRQLCELELLVIGAFSPLTGFMGRADYESVCTRMRLACGTLWPVPVTLDIPLQTAMSLAVGDKVALRDIEGMMVAVLTVEEIWQPEKQMEAELIFGTGDARHPGVAFLYGATGDCYVAGRIEGVELPPRYDFAGLRHSPRALRQSLLKSGHTRVIGYHARRPLHRAHVEFSKRAAQKLEAALLIHAVAGKEGSSEPAHFARVRACRAALPHYHPVAVELSLMQLQSRMCGPREAVWHAIIERNYGCSHFIVEHDYDVKGINPAGDALYGRFETQEFLAEHQQEIGIAPVPFRTLVYEEDHPEHFLIGIPSPKRVWQQEADHREAHRRYEEIASWFSYPAVLSELQRFHPPRHKRGFTIFFTGLSGAGKSTIAQALQARLMEVCDRPVTLLDGDAVRKHLSAGLGFSREHRDLNVLRLGYVASLIMRYAGIAICAPIAPYAQTRAQVRTMVEQYGTFIEVYVSTPLTECEARDRKGLYARARAGLIKEFTGISDPYEPPVTPELEINTAHTALHEAVEAIVTYLVRGGFVPDASVSARHDAVNANPSAPALHAMAGPAAVGNGVGDGPQDADVH